MVTYIIIGLTVIISLLCFKDRELMGKLSLNPYRVVHSKEWYRLITHGFVHADMTHLFVNMFTYWSFGIYIEQIFRAMGFGTGAYLGLYLGGMVAASIYDLFKYKNNAYYSSIGASGAVAAILFCAIFLNPWSKILFFAVLPIPGILFGVAYLFYCQYMARQGGGNINHNAHFYGAIYGFIFPLFLNPDLFHVFISHFLK